MITRTHTTTLGSPRLDPSEGGGVAAVALAANPNFTAATRGQPGAPILVVCEPPTPKAAAEGLPAPMDNLRLIAECAKTVGLGREDFLFVQLCPPLPEHALNSQSRKWKHTQPYVEHLLAQIEANNPKLVITMGDLATRSVMGEALKITRVRGRIMDSGPRLVVPMLSPGFVNKVPEHKPQFEADWLTVAKIKEHGWIRPPEDTAEVHYEWCTDLRPLLNLKPELISVDTETTGVLWWDASVRVLTVQISYRPGHTYVIPVDATYWPEWQGRLRERSRLLRQLQQLMADPDVKKVGHNFKFDVHMLRKLGVEVNGWTHDTQLLAFFIDENMMEKSLDECVRRWVPEMAGYNDENNRQIDKSRMWETPHDRMLSYAGGDTDATLRLFHRIEPLLARDPRQYNCYARIQFPAFKAFATRVERYGQWIDMAHFAAFKAEVAQFVEEQYDSLIRRVPAAVRRAYLQEARINGTDPAKVLSFTRPVFVRDVLFGPDGFGLEPVVFTDTTANLPPEQREPSTSTKKHLPFFTDREDAAGEFVRDYIGYTQAATLLSHFLEGFERYLSADGCIRPSYLLHRAVTGRTASQDPNGQNFPKRSRWAKLYQKIFKARPGYKLVSVDLSQIELRIAAWMSGDPEMLRIYREGGDIHTATAKAVMQLTDAQWDAMSKADRKLARTKAKAVNFGFLYGMGWRKFKSFAKTDYGVTYTEAEARSTRALFFAKYRRLEGWHERMKEIVARNGYVRAMHGAKRHLASIRSNDEGTRALAERQAVNSPVQRFGSDLGLMALARFSQQADPELFRILGFIHDALVMEVREGHEQEGIEALLYAMEQLPLREWFGITPPLPIKAEADIGLNGGEMIELAELPDREKWPQWFIDLNLPISEEGGKLVAAVQARKPDWWDDALDHALPPPLARRRALQLDAEPA